MASGYWLLALQARTGWPRARAALVRGGLGPLALHHVSRVPMRPFGRTISINTINKYGSTGAVCAIVNDAKGSRTRD